MDPSELWDVGRRDAASQAAGERFQRLFEDGPLAMAIVGEDYRLTEVNDAFCALTGYTAGELRELTFADITHPDDVTTDLRLAREVFAGEMSGYSIDKRYIRKSGEIVWVELTVAAIRDGRGRVLSGIGLVRDITELRRALADVQTEESAARERVQAAEAERARWARELHDETLQGLAGLHVMLSSETWASGAELRERIGEAQEQIENEMEKLRGLISELRPAALDELGLEASVKDLAERTQAVYGIEVETILELHQPDGEPRRLASEVETAAYRIVQESLGNAARHAGASRVTVELAQRNGSLGVRVRDDGSGFDPSNETAGFGLRGMRERVALLDGRLEIASNADGTEVAADMPLAD